MSAEDRFGYPSLRKGRPMGELASVCPSCGYGVPTSDGYCLNCSPPDSDDEDGYELDCTHCGREGLCWDGSDPLGDCPDAPHPCHACGGSGKRKDQVIF